MENNQDVLLKVEHLKKYYLKLVAGQMLYKHLLFELPA